MTPPPDIYTIYRGDRGTGKTTWLSQQAIEASRDGRVAIIVPTGRMLEHLARAFFGAVSPTHYRRSPVGFYTERTIEMSRGAQFNHIFVDEAQLFHINPIEMCQRLFPGVPATFTYTPVESDRKFSRNHLTTQDRRARHLSMTHDY